MSKTDCQLLRQKVCQRISVMKTNAGVFVVFKTKCELKCQFSGNIECVYSMYPKNWLFNSRFVLMTKNTPMIVVITEIF